MQVKLRPFTEDDWDGLAGAEKFADGTNPLYGEVDGVFGWPEDLGETHTIAVVVGGTGISLVGMDVNLDFSWGEDEPAGDFDAKEKAAMVFDAVAYADYFVFKEAGFLG
jgi:hypothetical protein